MRRKNKKFIDPRYFMDEKMEVLEEGFFGDIAAKTKEAVGRATGRAVSAATPATAGHTGPARADPEVPKEGKLAELKKHQEMLRIAQDFFMEKAKELGVEREYFESGFVKGANDMMQIVFAANHKRTGGKID